MSRDYKTTPKPKSTTKPKKKAATKAKNKSKKKTPLPPWVWVLCGLALGLVIGLSIYFVKNYLNNITTAVIPKVSPPSSAVKKTTKVTKPKYTKPKQEKTHFDFYTLLPEMEILIPEQLKANTPPMPLLDKPGTYVLQAGSFKNFEDADRLKASLALLGIEAKIQSVTINNLDTWHRVRIGPYQDLHHINKIHRQLQDNDINAMLLKIKT